MAEATRAVRGDLLHPEGHRVARVGWLRAAVLGANDGLVSTASLIAGVAAADTGKAGVLVAGVAGLVAGAMSMAAGEYVSVSSQADSEAADLARETRELAADPAAETRELAVIYQARGLDPTLSREVAEQLMKHDALGSHARDELGITEFSTARPIQAALTSALTFAAGGLLPMLVALAAPSGGLVWGVTGAAITGFLILGALGARAGGAKPARGMVRVVAWGVLAMGLTALIGRLFGAVV